MSRRKHRGFSPRPSNPAPFPDAIAPENTPTFSLDSQVNRARLEMGEARWAELNQEWNEVVPPEVIKARNDAAWQRAIAAAHYASLSAERRAQLEREWNA